MHRQFKLDHNNDDVWGNNGFHAPKYEFCFDFQRMDDKVKDGLVLVLIGVDRQLE